MKQFSMTGIRTGLPWTMLAATAFTMLAHAQTASPVAEVVARAQQQYNVDIAACNSAGYPAPQREACVRDAGRRLDNLRGVPPTPEAGATADGRATVMAPSTGSSVLRGSTTTTTGDGRATVVVPEATAPP